MEEFQIPFQTTVSSWVKVKAENLQDAVDVAYQQGVPGLMHLNHTYPDVGDWEVPEWFYEENPELDEF